MITFDDRLANPAPGSKNDRRHFFKYMNESTAKIVLKNQTVRWATRDYLNDPFELHHQVLAKVDKVAVRQRVIDQLWDVFQGRIASAPTSLIGPMLGKLRQQQPNMTREQFDAEYLEGLIENIDRTDEIAEQVVGSSISHFARVKILSLTTRPDNAAMWNHYSNGYKGVVLRFRSSATSLFAMAEPVEYTDVVPAFVTEDFMVHMLAGTPLPPTGPVTHSIIFRKSPEWSYEHEWRLTLGFGRDRSAPYEDLPWGSDELDGVIFGTHTTAADKDEIRRLCEVYPHVELMQASMVPGKATFDINVVP